MKVTMMILKTTVEHFAKVEKYIKEQSKYEAPEVIKIVFKKENASYLDWVNGETK